MLNVFILVFAGFGVGFLGTILGIGGGSIIVPVLVLWFGYPMHTAIATSLIAIVGTSINAASANILSGAANLKLGIFLEIITVFFAISGGFISISVTEKPLMILFGGLLGVIGIIYYARIKIDDQYIEDDSSFFGGEFFDHEKGNIVKYKPKNILLISIISGFAGLMSGMLGIGGGVLKVPSMNIIGKIPIRATTATSNFMIGLTAAAGAIVYVQKGYLVPLNTALILIGVTLGSKFASVKFKRIKDRKIKIIFTIFLFVIAIQMFLKGIG